jgi:hypothetical protein
MTKSIEKNKANAQLLVTDPEEVNRLLMAKLDEIKESWQAEQTGFPPYWRPDGSPGFIGRVIGKQYQEEDEESFARWIISPTYAPVVCFRGPGEDAEQVVVQPGECFTMSEYSSIDMKRFQGTEISLCPKNKRKLNNGTGHTLWDWDLRVSPESKALMLKRAEELEQRLLSGSHQGG